MSAKRAKSVWNRPNERGGGADSPSIPALFRGLTEAESRKAARLMEEKRYPKGATIFRKNDPGDSLYVLEEGLVKLVAHSQKGAGTILFILRPADIFGELLLSEEKRPFDALAVTDVIASVLSRDDLVELLSSSPTVSLNFIRILTRRLVHVENGVADFSHTWSYHRLSKVLLELCEECGEVVPGGVLIRLPLIHADLANMIGTTRETVTNQLNRFKRMGLVSSRGRQLVVDNRRLGAFIRSEATDVEGEDPPFEKSA